MDKGAWHAAGGHRESDMTEQLNWTHRMDYRRTRMEIRSPVKGYRD